MKIGEILRGIADALDADEQLKSQPVAVAEPVNATAQQPDDLFVPPLQLKMELLKKAVDVESIYDTDESEEEHHSYPDMMTQIRRNAGINPAVVAELSDDEPLDV